MSETPFYKTRMGHRFYEHTMPELVRVLERIGTALEKLSDQEKKPGASPVESVRESK